VEAERIAADIVAAGGHCQVLRYDALLPAGEQLQGLGIVDCCYLLRDPKNIPAQVSHV